VGQTTDLAVNLRKFLLQQTRHTKVCYLSEVIYSDNYSGGSVLRNRV
jgi:hypothetical protein